MGWGQGNASDGECSSCCCWNNACRGCSYGCAELCNIAFSCVCVVYATIAGVY